MISYILIGLFILIGLYFYMQQSKNTGTQVYNQDLSPNKVDFYPSDTFNGAKKDYVFKNDSKGLGYYFDVKPTIE
jgi:hypothetical protein